MEILNNIKNIFKRKQKEKIEHELSAKEKDNDVLKEYYKNGQLKMEVGLNTLERREYDKEGKMIYERFQNKSGNIIEREYESDTIVKKEREYCENGNIIDREYGCNNALEKEKEYYPDGKLLRESKKEALSEIGLVHYFYNVNGDIQRIEYAPAKNEYLKIFSNKTGEKEVFYESEGNTKYKKYDENWILLEIGKFDEEMKKTGEWITLDELENPIKKETYSQGKLIKSKR